MTLPEVLVATTVLCVAVGVALTVYDVCRKTQRRGERAAEQQQIVRGAIQRFLADARMAGVNHNPGGDPGRPDEAIEAAFDTAVILRGDFDGHDPVESTEPEDLLSGPRFEEVSTGNDEIVAWFLAKPDGSSPDSLVFEADVAEVPRDGGVETVVIPRVSLTHDDPPYTLYRATLNGNGTAVRAPVADHLSSMRLVYYDAASRRLNPLGGDEANAAGRARIRRIAIEIRGTELSLGTAVRPRSLGFPGALDGAP
ncbi:MAG: hypothetical protein R3344_10935 [Acidobacteriota bacterium]|nr:hypothetical protein [Acidobacteriota bacterium]